LKSVDLVSRSSRFTHLPVYALPAPGKRKTAGKRKKEQRLPADFLDVLIHGNSQLAAAAQAAAFQDIAAISSGHTRTKTMNTYTAANLGLVCPFCRHIFFLSAIDFCLCVLRKSPNACTS
jgi:hypothetical protein